MFGTRRLAKRSIIGTKVCAPWQDGRYYPGIIQSSTTQPNGQERYTVLFDDGYTRCMSDQDIIGPGFQSIHTAMVKRGQKVYLTYNGREFAGHIMKRLGDLDEFLVDVKLPNGHSLEVSRRIEDVRLLESRKSARLQDTDTDYSRLADMHSEPKKRTVSHFIDVPLPAAKQSCRRKSSSDSDEMCQDQKDELSCNGLMDTHTAAMVLTSLSCSPQSPKFPSSFTDIKGDNISPGGASSLGSSGVCCKSEPSTPSSPPGILHHSAPSQIVFGTPPLDEGIELDETSLCFDEPSNYSNKRQRTSTKTVFKCTWPGCGKIYNTIAGIEKHVRSEHLEPKGSEDSEDMSDHEEEFYYQEIEVSVDTVTQTFADMYTSSPPNVKFMDVANHLPDHDYPKKEPKSTPLNIPGAKNISMGKSNTQGSSYPITMPVTIPQLSRSLSWQIPQTSNSVSPPIRVAKVSPSPKNHYMGSSPKNSPMHKKSRSEVKKCRKVYGMENRDMWCTQCKWKKACTRFMD